MNESEFTRVVRLRADVHRGRAPNDATSCHGTGEYARARPVDHHALFNHHQRRLRQVIREYAKPGVVVFALHAEKGIAGHLWLEATAKLRAGTIGRHQNVDLHLADDEELSLRHLLLLVRRSAGALRLRVSDLATPSGFHAEEGGVLRAVTADGTLVLRAASYSLLVVPTGSTPPWDPDAADPWLTLPPRVAVPEARAPSRHRPRARQTEVTAVRGLVDAGPGPDRLLEPGELVQGHLVITTAGGEQKLAISERALQRGIIIGRYTRCAGDTSLMPDNVSRVHAVAIAVDGEVHIVDAGSTNGVLIGREEVKCASIETGATCSLGGTLVRWEPHLSSPPRAETRGPGIHR